MVRNILTACLALLACVPSARAETDEAGARIVSVVTKPVQVNNVVPDYPQDARMFDTEGWVVVNYVVNADGTTGNIKIVDSSIERVFDQSVIEAIGKLRFEPATWNGIPITYLLSDNVVFYRLGSVGIELSPSFHAFVRRTLNAIEEGDLEKAERLIDKAERRNAGQRLKEIAWMDILKGELYAARDDKQQALRYYNRALFVIEEYEEGFAHEKVLRNALLLSAQLGRFAEALRNYDDLVELEGRLAPDDPASRIATKIRDFIAGDTPYRVAGELAPNCATCEENTASWSQRLLRDELTLENVAGAVTELTFQCARSSVTVVYEPEMVWKVDSRGSDCSVMVQGEPGTTFDLVEL